MHCTVAQAVTPAGTAVEQIRRLTHIFRAARDNNVRVTAADRLCAQRNTLQAGAAHFIDGESTGAFRYTAAQQDLARRVLSESGL